jgi:hypothetical protein
MEEGAAEVMLSFMPVVAEAGSVPPGVTGVELAVEVPSVAEAALAVALGYAGVGLYAWPLQLRQLSQPVRAIPAHKRPTRPTTGFLPIGFPFALKRFLAPEPPARRAVGDTAPRQ